MLCLQGITLRSSAHHVRDLNSTWESTKETAINTYEGLKNTVERNLILSISISVSVVLLLIICCWLRRKYTRDAQLMSKREHDRLMEQRAMRTRTNEANRRKNRDKRNGKAGKKESESNLANTSMETKATILSDTKDGFRDIENGGIEMKLDGRIRTNSIKAETNRDFPKKTSGFRSFGRNRSEN